MELPLVSSWRLSTMTLDMPIELSAAQLEIWLAQALAPTSSIYNVGETFDLPTSLDRRCFEEALGRTIAETEALHVRFTRNDRGPRQRRRQPPVWRLHQVTLGDAADALEVALQDELAKPIDVEGKALFHATLFELPDRFVWCQLYHHIVMDGYGRSLFAKRVGAIYTDLTKGLEGSARSFGSLEDLLCEDADYRETSEATDRAHWLRALAGYEPRGVRSHQGADGFRRQTHHLSPEQSAALRAFSRQSGFSLSHVLAAAALHEATFDGGGEASIGFVVSGRTTERLRATPGAVSNVVPIRGTVSPRDSWRQLLERTKTGVAFALDHQRTRLEDLRRDLGMTGSGAELTPAVVNVIPFFAPIAFGDATTLPNNLSNGPIDDVSVVAYPHASQASLRLDFNANIATRSPAELASFADRVLRVLSAMVSDTDGRIGTIDLLSADERALVLETWNATAAPIPAHTPAAAFEAQVSRTPDTAALTCGATTWTYRDLDARADGIAHAIVAAGLGPEDRVALLLPRKADLVAALLGVLKSGAAYLPLDPAHPPARIAAIVRDAGVRLCLTDADGAPRLPEHLPRLNLTEPLPDDTGPSAPGHHRLAPRNAAYLLYTSGSTGTPKGVVVEQRAVADLIAWAHDTYADALDRVFVTTSLSFDVSVFEILAPLCRGGEIVLLPDLLALAEEARREPETARPAMISGVPSALASLLDHAALPRALSAVVLAGEALPARLVRRLRAERPGCRISNVYGPTEATVYATAWHADPESDGEGAPPIGRPVRNTRTFVLDAALRPVAPGIAGDLYLAGPGLARGYNGRPDLTAERFVANPHGAPGERMYHTGDRARWRPDGTLDYLGRSDHQVKVRGFRIEPGEIEERLTRHPDVADVVVVPRDLGTGLSSLVAYVVMRQTTVLDAAVLRAHLAEALPDYMVPATFVPLAALPLGPTGKLDRTALPAPDTAASEPRGTAPATLAEIIVAQLFAEILGTQNIDAETNFFHKGGHSLLALRLLGSLRQRVGVRWPLSTIFQSPTVAALARRIEMDSPAIAPDSDDTRAAPRRIPVSGAQRRLWLLDRLEGALPAYNVPLALDLDGVLDVPALRQAIDDVVARHEPLRTLFGSDEGEPYLVPLAAAPVPLPVHAATPEGLAASLTVESRKTFDLARDRPLRAALFVVAPQRHVLLFTFHHVAVDGTSLTPFLHDLASAYAAHHGGHAPGFTPLPLSYADYAAREQRDAGRHGDGMSTDEAAFWTSRLAELPPETTLPHDRPRPAVFDDEGDTFDFQVPAPLHDGVLRLSRATGTSPFMVAHAALVLLLLRLGAGQDMAIGTPISGRDDPALADVVGCFANTLVLRTDTAGNPTFREMLERVKAADLAAFDHASTPFERLIEWINPPRSLAVHPLFQVMLVFANADAPPAMAGLTVSRRAVTTKSSKFDLSVLLRDHRDASLQPLGMSGTLEFSTTLYSRDTMERFARLFLRVLSAMVSDADDRIGTIDLLGPDERALVLETWNATAAPIPAHTPAAAFEAQVSRTPDTAALTCGATTWTYRDLDARADGIAHAIVAAGLGPEDRVALLLPRKADLVAALLGVLKSGAAYLPLDPAHPPARIAAIVRDAGVRLCLTDADGAPRLPEHLPRLNLTEPLPDDTGPSAPGHHRLAPRNAAYLLYTSGSTGTPKGVVVEQRAVADLIAWAHDTYADALDRVFVTTSLSFDVSVFEILAPLCRGGEIVLLPDLLALAEEARREPETARPAMISGVPSALASLLDHAALPRALSAVVLAGEALPARLVRRLRAERPECRISNVYGPTEATVYATAWHAAPDSDGEGAPPIGRPVRNTRTFVLDAALRPVPPGVAGDLYLAGPGLARGYNGRPDLTAERFVADPHGAPGERMYHTGDRARWRPDGTLDYLGRSDHQVKVRGFRIEPGEIEERLTRHSDVADAVVVTRDLGTGLSSLVAYVVMRQTTVLDAAVLRAHLAEALPDYMVPATFVPLAALPLGHTGKLDRAALPAPDTAASEPRGTAPATPAELIVAELFAEILGTQNIDADTNFFHKGGDSISSLRLVALARARGLAFTPRDVFRNQSVAALAAAATTVTTIAPREDIPGTHLPPTPIMSWLRDRGSSDHFSQSVVLDVPCTLTPSILSAMLDLMVERHDALRLRLLEDGTLDVLPPTRGRFAEVIRSVDADPDYAQLRSEAAQRLAPRDGRMIEAVLIRNAAGEASRLLLLLHHLAVDGVSWRIIGGELADCWALLTGAQAAAPRAAVPGYRLWAHRLAETAKAQTILADLDHWCDVQRRSTWTLADGPLDIRRDVIDTRRVIETRLTAGETSALLQRTPARLGLHVNDLFLAGLLLAARAVHGVENGGLTIDLEGHGREAIVPDLDIGQTIGWFTSLYPVHLDGPAGRDALRPLLRDVKEILRRIPAKGLSYGMLRYLNAETAPALSAAPTPDVCFNYLGRFGEGSGFWQPASGHPSLEATRDPDMALAHAIEILARIGSDDGLVVEWAYAPSIVDSKTIEAFASSWAQALRDIIALGDEDDVKPIVTPSDVPLVALTQPELDALVARTPDFETILPLTPLQEGLLFHSIYDERSRDTYIVQLVATLGGPVDDERLEQACGGLIARHPMLRASFDYASRDRPVQTIAASAPLDFQVLTVANSEAERAWLEADQLDRFDPSRTPLVRFRLLRRTGTVLRLVITMHHLLLDGWSIPIVARDLVALYDGKRLPPPVSHAIFMEWLVAQDQSAAIEQWTAALADAAPLNRVIADRGAAPMLAGVARAALTIEQTEALAKAAGALHVTPSVMVQAAWSILLARLTRHEQVSFGVTVSGRPPSLAGADRIVGLLINTLPLRLKIDGRITIRDLCHAVQEEVARLLAHPNVPLIELQRIAGQGELFDTLLVYESYPDREREAKADGFRIEAIEGRETSHYPLSLLALPGKTLHFRLNYRADLFAPGVGEALLARMVRLVTELASAPERRVKSLAAADDDGLVPGGTALAFEDVLARFRRQVERRPDAVAVVAGRDELSFATLDRWSDHLAAGMAAQGIGREHRVAILFERCTALVAAILAVLKTGAAFVPLEPAHPVQRLRDTIALSGATLTLCSAKQRDRLALDKASIVDRPTFGPPFAGPPPIGENAAYVLFTSGTTGLPKGVVVTRRGLASYASWAIAAYDLGEGNGAAVTTSIAFDATITSLLLPLLAGERTVLLDDTQQFELIAQTRAPFSLLKVTPSQVDLMTRLVPEDRLGGIAKRLVIGGESLAAETIRPWRQSAGSVGLVNEYGPTESVVGCVTHSVAASDPDTGGVPIGRPIDGTDLMVLDDALQPAPAGMPGELYLVGEGVARGYDGRTDLTAERFVAAPGRPDGARMYRTGDLVIRRTDGVLHYLGRTDQQLKIRGHRVEAAEIESALLKLEAVSGALAFIRRNEDRARLIGYVVAPDVPTDWRGTLAASLPDYMVPDDLVALSAFPLTRNGKIDRDALPDPSRVEVSIAVPTTAGEEALAAIVAKLLKLDTVGVDQSFFALGGDSILSIQLVSRARKAGYVLKPQQIFQLQTVRALAAAAKPVKAATPLATIPRDAAADRFAATPVMNWLRRRGGPIGRYAQSMLVPVPTGTTSAAIDAALCHLRDVHAMLRTRLVVDADGSWILESTAAGAESLLKTCRLAGGDRETAVTAERLALAERLAPESGIMLAATWFEDADRLLVGMHHLASDGVSLRIIAQDLEDLFAGRVIDEPAASFADHVAAAAAVSHQTELPFWLSQTGEGALLPSATLDRRADLFAGRTLVSVELGGETSRALLDKLPQRYRAGLDDLLMAALLVAVRSESTPTPLRIDIEGHGRDGALDLTRTVGWFTLMHPLLLVPSQTATGDDALLAAVRAVKTTRRQVPGDGAGYGVLRRLGETGHDAGTAALHAAGDSQVLFNYLGRTSGALEGFGATADPDLPLAHILSINAAMRDGDDATNLVADWSFAPRLLEGAEVTAVADRWLAALDSLARLADRAHEAMAPSDVPLVELTQAQLDRMRRAVPDIVDVLPLAPLQAGLLFHARYEGDSGTSYISQLVLDLEGNVDAPRMKASADRLVARHESLRATFLDTDDGRPLQVIRRAPDLVWREEDRPAGDGDDRRAALRRVMDADRAAGFHLDRGDPLARFSLVHHGAKRFSLLCTFHHIAVDGWSMPTIIGDLLTFHADPNAVLPAPMPRADYFRWLVQQDRAAGLRAWLDTLEGLPEPTRLFPDATGGSAERFELRRPLPHEIEQALAARSRALGVTVATLMQTAWAIMLARLTRRDDVVFGITVNGRPPELAGVETSVGLFINTLPLRIALKANETVTALAQRIQASQVDLLPHQHIGLAEIQRGAGLGELFDTLLAYENYPLDRGALSAPLGGVALTRIWGSDAAHYPLSVVIVPNVVTELRFNLRANVMDEATVAAIADRFTVLLEEIARDPDLTTGAVGVRQTAQTTPTLALSDIDVSAIFDRVSAEQPDAVAIVDGEASVTYVQLATSANRLAQDLLAQGLTAGAPVIVMLPRGSRQVVAMLAVLKAGGFYIPLDEALPHARVADIVAESRAGLAIVAGRTVAAMPPEMTAIDLDNSATADRLTGRDAAPPYIRLHELSAAYAIYTSGSTGRPKGVVVTHANILRLFEATKSYGFGPQDRWSLFHSAAFDFSVWEIWGALLHGGRVVVVPWDVSRDAARFLDLLVAEGVTILNQTPSAFYQLSDAVEALGDRLGELALRLVVFGGEALDPARLRNWFARFGTDRPRLVNMYGITETTVHVTEIALPTPATDASPIGRPIADLSVHLLDHALQEVPDGMVGEIFVGGGGLARGYLARPDLTAERFVADPTGDPGARLYRSGDLARRRADRSLAYVGRSDQQVKIRGFRIELGEIESGLAALEGVARTVVIAREAGTGQRRLVAYVVPAPGTALDAATLKSALATYLPGYMVPSAFVLLPSLPLTRNGKVDRAALPAPETTVTTRREPRDEREATLCGLFAEVLGLDAIGIADEFFALGGDSLLAMRLIGLLRARLQVACSIRTLFEHPTVETLARSLDEAAPPADPLAGAVTFRSGGGRPTLFCVHPGGGLSWVYARLLRHLAADQPIVGLQAHGFADGDILPATIEDMAADYLRRMRQVQPRGPYHLLGWSFGGLVAQALAARLEREGEAAGLLALFDAYPVRAADQMVPMRDQDLLDDQMAMMGAAPQPVDSSLRDALLADRGALSMLRPRDIEAIVRITRNNVRMATGWQPPRLAGDMHLFVADAGLAPPFDWSGHVGGTLHRHLIPCRHGDMLKPGPLDAICRILDPALRKIKGS